MLPALALCSSSKSLSMPIADSPWAHNDALHLSELARKWWQELAGIEINGLKIAEDRSFADCARYILTSVMALCGPAPPRTREEYKPLFCASQVATGTPVRASLPALHPLFQLRQRVCTARTPFELSWARDTTADATLVPVHACRLGARTWSSGCRSACKSGRPWCSGF